jgi:hypothetical protein
MLAQFKIRNARRGEQGSTLFIVAGSLTILLGIGALAIDIASLYVARSESQRAADAAALAGAKIFVESGCVTSGNCSSEETAATDRATQVALQNLVAGQPLTVSGVSFVEQSQNPQITVQVQSRNLHVYFAAILGVTSAPTVGATATAEAYNPSGQAGGPQFCTACVRPWLIPNCQPSYATPSNCLLSLSGGAIQSPTGVIGQPLQIAVETQQTQFGAIDNGSDFAGYQKSIFTCNTGQMTCGSIVHTLLGSKIAYTTPGVDSLLHIPSGATGRSQGQDWIDPTVYPPQVHAGASNPLVVQGVVAQDAVVATSDSIVTAYLYDNRSALHTDRSDSVMVLGFAQIFITQVDASGDVWGVILGAAGCSQADTDCDPGAIKGSSMLPIRLITPPGS